jgi:hypothetical protein
MVADQQGQAELEGFVDHQPPGFPLAGGKHQRIGQGIPAPQLPLIDNTRQHRQSDLPLSGSDHRRRSGG